VSWSINSLAPLPIPDKDNWAIARLQNRAAFTGIYRQFRLT
jgi:hypothetical protein